MAPSDSAQSPIPEPNDALTTAAIAIAAPDSKSALRQILVSTVIMAGIAVGQVVITVLPQIIDAAGTMLPAWLPGIATSGAAIVSAWLLQLARRNHTAAVTEALYTDSALVIDAQTQRKFYTVPPK